MLEQCGVIIVAGGQSRRMGRDKWMLQIGGLTVLERIVGVFYESCAELRIVTAAAVNDAPTSEDSGRSDPHRYPDLSRYPSAVYIRDEQAGIGPLGGISAGLAHSGCEWNVVAACDMPFPSLALAAELLQACKRHGAMVAIPEFRGRLHPLFAVYRHACTDSLNAYIAGGGRKVMDWLDNLSPAIVPESRIHELDPARSALFNMNRPDDYEEALRLFNPQ